MALVKKFSVAPVVSASDSGKPNAAAHGTHHA